MDQMTVQRRGVLKFKQTRFRAQEKEAMRGVMAKLRLESHIGCLEQFKAAASCAADWYYALVEQVISQKTQDRPLVRFMIGKCKAFLSYV